MGLAIFSCMRSGLWMSGSGGSGVLIARKADGTWSPPSGILLHTAALGFVMGVDIYDCVLVINSVSALEMFTRPRVTLGTDVGLSLGPLISAGQPDSDERWRELTNTVLSYLKARGRHQAAQLDGSLVTERANENERFYDSTVDVLDVVAGNVRKSIPEITPLFEVIKAAEGRSDFDTAVMSMLSQQPAPGDAVIETPDMSPVSPKTPFGVPDVHDPDPFGVIALEMAGLEIREAGTKLRPTSSQFEYNPSPNSPLFSKFSGRQSVDTFLTRSNRGSYMSSRTQGTNMTDACTQTDTAGTPDTTLSPSYSDDGRDQATSETTSVAADEPDEVDYTKVDMSVIKHLSRQEPSNSTATMASATTQTHREPARANKPRPQLPAANDEDADSEAKTSSSTYPDDERDEFADDEDEEDEDEEPVIFEVATTTQPTRATIMSSQVTHVIQAKGSLVTIPKRIPPPLPARSPARASRGSKSDYGGDLSMISSPLRQSFQSARAEPASPEAKEGDEALSKELLTEKLDDVATAKEETDGASRHARSSPSINTAAESRFSMESVPEAPPTPQGTDPTSSIDDSDHGPQTPRPEDHFHQHSAKEIEIDHIDSGAIAVA